MHAQGRRALDGLCTLIREDVRSMLVLTRRFHPRRQLVALLGHRVLDSPCGVSHPCLGLAYYAASLERADTAHEAEGDHCDTVSTERQPWLSRPADCWLRRLGSGFGPRRCERQGANNKWRVTCSDAQTTTMDGRTRRCVAVQHVGRSSTRVLRPSSVPKKNTHTADASGRTTACIAGRN